MRSVRERRWQTQRWRLTNFSEESSLMSPWIRSVASSSSTRPPSSSTRPPSSSTRPPCSSLDMVLGGHKLSRMNEILGKIFGNILKSPNLFFRFLSYLLPILNHCPKQPKSRDWAPLSPKESGINQDQSVDLNWSLMLADGIRLVT